MGTERSAILRTGEPRSYGVYIVSLALLVGGLLAYLWCHVTTMRQADDLARLREERLSLIHEQEKLRAEITGLKQSSRIRGIAMTELGMVFPTEPPRNLYLTDVTAAVGSRESGVRKAGVRSRESGVRKAGVSSR